MSANFDPIPAAQRLAIAWRNQQLLAGLPPQDSPRDDDEAYAVQQALQNELGEGSAGWKIGGATATALRTGPTGRPSFGFLLPSCVRPAGPDLRITAPGKVVLEVEIAVRFSREATPAQEAFDPAGMLGAVHLAVEVVCSRFANGKGAGELNFLADSAGFHALVVGSSLAGAASSELLQAPASLWRDGAQVSETFYGDDRTDPLAALQLFWAAAARSGTVVPAGALITTGTLIRPLETDVAGAYEARLGEARALFQL